MKSLLQAINESLMIIEAKSSFNANNIKALYKKHFDKDVKIRKDVKNEDDKFVWTEFDFSDEFKNAKWKQFRAELIKLLDNYSDDIYNYQNDTLYVKSKMISED